MTLPLDPSQRPTPVAAARPAMGWWRRHRVLRNWLGGVASAVVVSVISGVALAYLTPGADTPGGTPPTSAAADQTPFSVDVLSRGDYCKPYVVNADPGELASPYRVMNAESRDWPADDEVAEWAQRVEAIPSRSRVTLTLQGTSDTSVVLHSLEVEVKQRGPALDAPRVFFTEEGCGSGAVPRFFRIDLDKPNPRALPQAGEDLARKEIPAVAFPFKVSDSDPEIFVIEADPGACDCTWQLRLRWSSAGRSGALVIDDHGRPFRTAAYVEASAQRFVVHAAHGCPGDLAWCEAA
ncbi:hypothetical protein [Catellatospora coxensis]|uniref:Uncharacterized protein n=1 Tax=Catellatospora coxensis TaxID=310354 RepID=A0A8J3KZI6_9ACTN|nr:hypothetical protein [Catellatospora coxensis]GIG09172.1 hypothetical protein Cco03nite_58720 [Catellatospora coxensis]